MGKHSKNNNDRAFFSYHERRAANFGRHSSGMLGGHNTAGGNYRDRGWGSETRTLDLDSMKDLDACSLSLQVCVDPVVTPRGVLYDKEVIYEYILDRKKEIERELRAWEAQQASQAAEAAEKALDRKGSRRATWQSGRRRRASRRARSPVSMDARSWRTKGSMPRTRASGCLSSLLKRRRYSTSLTKRWVPWPECDSLSTCSHMLRINSCANKQLRINS